jgi:hypothetical protein
LGFYEATKITAKSEWMRDEIIRIYKVPKERIGIVSPNTSGWINDVLRTYTEIAGGTKTR